MRIEHFLCWMCEQPRHYSVSAWHEIKPGQREIVCDDCWTVLKEKKAA